MPFAEDRSLFFGPNDIGVKKAVWSGGTIYGAFFPDYIATLTDYGAGTEPRFQCDGDAASGIVLGTSIAIDGSNYVVRKMEPDNDIMNLTLDKQ